MKKYTASLILLLLVASVSGQDIKQKVKKFRNGKRFSVTYDKFKDTTWVTAGPFASGSKAGGALSSGITFKGEQPAGQVVYYFIFDSYNRDWLFLRESDRELYALIDSERMRLGTGERYGNIERGFMAGLSDSGLVHERLVYPLEAKVFHKLATFNSVELKVGGYEFKLKGEHQQAFRDLMSLVLSH